MNDRTSQLRRVTAVAGGAFALAATVASVAFAREALFGTRARPPLLFRSIARGALAADLDSSLERVLTAADAHYAKVAPKVTMASTAPGRLEVRTSAYLLALFRAMREEGIGEDRATALLQRGLFGVMRQVWRVPEGIARVAGARYPTDRRARIQVRLARLAVFRDPDWAMHEVPPDGAYGIDVTRCVVRDFFVSEGAARLCDEVMCRQDVLMAEARGVPFMRTGTLARGDALCDFRFG